MAPRDIMLTDKVPRMSALANSAAVEGSGTEVTVNFTGCGFCGLEIWIVPLVPG